MTDFSCPVVRVAATRPIPDADEIEHVRVFGLDVIAPKGKYHAGDLAIYAPPDAVLPQELATSLKGQAKLFGERRNRVRAYRLRGAVSEGVLIPGSGTLGDDAAPALGITHYEIPVPTPWRGDCIYMPSLTVAYDIRSARRYPHVLGNTDEVELTEKLHGTMCAIGFFPRLSHPELLERDTLVYSKGLSETGHTLKASNHANLYVRTVEAMGLRDRVRAAFNGRPATVFGEIFGGTIQDLSYGRIDPSFAVFDVYLGTPGRGRWLDRDEFALIANEIAPPAPVLYRGRLDPGIVQQLASGPTVAGKLAHIREGVVIRPMQERTHPRVGRAILKYVSTDYLTRANGSEFH